MNPCIRAESLGSATDTPGLDFRSLPHAISSRLGESTPQDTHLRRLRLSIISHLETLSSFRESINPEASSHSIESRFFDTLPFTQAMDSNHPGRLYLKRTDGSLVPLVPVDELPQNITIQGLPRVLAPEFSQNGPEERHIVNINDPEPFQLIRQVDIDAPNTSISVNANEMTFINGNGKLCLLAHL